MRQHKHRSSFSRYSGRLWRSVAQNLGDLSGKIVVDVSYPVRRGADGYMEQSVEPSAGELIQIWNPRAKVVKVGIPSSYIVDDPTTLGTNAHRADRGERSGSQGDGGASDCEHRSGSMGRGSTAVLAFDRIVWAAVLGAAPAEAQRGRIEIKLIRSLYWPVRVWDVVKEFGPTADYGNLAHFPKRESPRPCDSYKPQ